MEHDIVVWGLGAHVIVNTIGIALSYALVLKPPMKLKIQNRSYTVATLNERMKLIGLNLVLLFGITWAALATFEHIFSWTPIAWWLIVVQVFAISLIDDTFFYFYHRWLHENKTVYKKIHLKHHKAFTPLPIEYIYVHPLEWFMGTGGPALGFIAMIALGEGEMSAYTFVIYTTLRAIHELEIHSGIKTVVLSRIIPFYGTAEHHDLHHAKPNCGNYAATYTFWDKIFGTEAQSPSQ